MQGETTGQRYLQKRGGDKYGRDSQKLRAKRKTKNYREIGQKKDTESKKEDKEMKRQIGEDTLTRDRKQNERKTTILGKDFTQKKKE